MSLTTRPRRALAVALGTALAATLAATVTTGPGTAMPTPTAHAPAVAPASGDAQVEVVPSTDATCAPGEQELAPGVCADPDAAPHDPREGYEVHGLPAAAAANSARYTWGAPTATKAVNPPCSKPGTTGNRIQAVYVYFSNQKSRYSTTKPIIQKAMLQANGIYYYSAKQTGGTRHLRIATDSACKPSVAAVRLPSTAAASFAATTAALRKAGYNKMDRKYMAFVEARKLCGVGEVFYDDQAGVGNRNNRGNTIARADLGCWDGTTAAHEITHMLGAVQKSAARNDGSLHCRDERDLMCYKGAGPKSVYVDKKCAATVNDERLDCNKNDYFHTKPAAGSYLAKKWNTARSSFLWYGGAAYVYSPGAVRNLNAVAYNSTTMKVTFAGPVVDHIHGPAKTYRIYRDSKLLTTQTSGTFYDRAALPGKSTYWVIAVNGTGTGPRVGKTVTRPDLVPALATNVKAAQTTKGVTLSWGYPAVSPTGGLATGVKVIKNGKELGSWGTRLTGISDGSPVTGLNTYQVILTNAQGAGKPVTVTATYAPPPPPGVVTGLKATSGSSSVTLTWVAPKVTATQGAAAYYQVWRGEDFLGFAWSTSYVDSSPVKGTVTYRVASVNGAKDTIEIDTEPGITVTR